MFHNHIHQTRLFLFVNFGRLVNDLLLLKGRSFRYMYTTATRRTECVCVCVINIINQHLNSQIFLLNELFMMYRTGIQPNRMDPDMVI